MVTESDRPGRSTGALEEKEARRRTCRSPLSGKPTGRSGRTCLRTAQGCRLEELSDSLKQPSRANRLVLIARDLHPFTVAALAGSMLWPDVQKLIEIFGQRASCVSGGLHSFFDPFVVRGLLCLKLGDLLCAKLGSGHSHGVPFNVSGGERLRLAGSGLKGLASMREATRGTAGCARIDERLADIA